MLKRSNMALRFGIGDLLQTGRRNRIPMVVVSGGIKENVDVIFSEILRGLNY